MEEREMTEEQRQLQKEMRELQIMMDPTLRPQSISSAALMDQDYVPAEFVVKGLLPKGLTILGGSPKIGKSWMVLDLCHHVAKGEPFLGMEVTQGTVWYLSYEDNSDRMKHRLACIGADGLENFHISTREHELGTMAGDLPEAVDRFMREHPDTKLIVMDTMQLAKLSCTGRDIAQRELELRFDRQNFHHSNRFRPRRTDQAIPPYTTVCKVFFPFVLPAYCF
jgi:predicted ATP-dependent serine protease